MRAIVVALVSIVVTACAPPAPVRDDAAIRADVTALVQRWSDAGEAGDFDAVADTYANAEGFAWIERGEVAYADHAAIVAGLEQAREGGLRIVNDVANIEVTPLSVDAAAYRADYTLTVSSEAFSFTSAGIVSGVAIRQGETWRLLQGSFSERPAEQTTED